MVDADELTREAAMELIAKAAEWMGPWLAVGAMALAVLGLSLVGRRLMAESAAASAPRRGKKKKRAPARA